MVRSGALRGSLIVLVATVLSLSSGCGGDSPEAKPFDGSNKSEEPSASSTPTPTPTPSPSQSRGDTEQQLYNATVHFYKVVGEAYHTQDVSGIKELVVPGSQAGSGNIAAIKRMKREGERYAQAVEYTVSEFDFKGDADQQTETVSFNLSFAGAKVVDSTGDVTRTSKPRSVDGHITFAKEGSSWLVVMEEFDTNG